MHFIKYLIEGMVVAVVSSLNRKNTLTEMILIGLTASVTFFILDTYAPEIYQSTKQGTGFGFGLNMLPTTTISSSLQTDVKPAVPPMNPIMTEPAGPQIGPQAGPQVGPIQSLELFESPAQSADVERNVPKPYKWHTDNYATKTVMPGYNEDVKGYNEDEILSFSSLERNISA